MWLQKTMTIAPWVLNLPQPILFVLVGGFAASVHFLSVIILVEIWDVPKLVANFFAFLIAFCFSFLGQRHLTFSKTQQTLLASLKKYFFISFAAFGANEFLFFICLKWFDIPYLIALPMVLLVVAVGTFLLSKRWAFKS